MRKYRTGEKAQLTYLSPGDLFALNPREFVIESLTSENGFWGRTGSGRNTFYLADKFLEDISFEGSGKGRGMVVTEGERYRELHQALEKFREDRENWLSRYRKASERGKGSTDSDL